MLYLQIDRWCDGTDIIHMTQKQRNKTNIMGEYIQPITPSFPPSLLPSLSPITSSPSLPQFPLSPIIPFFHQYPSSNLSPHYSLLPPPFPFPSSPLLSPSALSYNILLYSITNDKLFTFRTSASPHTLPWKFSYSFFSEEKLAECAVQIPDVWKRGSATEVLGI